MNIDEIVKRISKTDGLSKTLGMKFISTPEPDTIMATMKVDERNRQPFGFLRHAKKRRCWLGTRLLIRQQLLPPT